MSSNVLEEQVEATRAMGVAICAALNGEAQKLGFDEDHFQSADFDHAKYSLQRDPSNGQDSLVCDWIDAHGQRCGQMLFHADGSFWAEYDVVRPHPTDRRWFVEAVTAWGRGHSITSEPRLLPQPD